MNRIRFTAGLAATALAGCFALGLWLTGWTVDAQTQSSSAKILVPPDNSTVTNEVRLIAVGKADAPQPEIKLDGTPLVLERITFGEGWSPRGGSSNKKAVGQPTLQNDLLKDKRSAVVYSAPLNLSPGAHTIETGGEVTHVFRSAKDGSDAPPGFQVFSMHPGVPDAKQAMACEACHESKTALNPVKLPDTCQTCHSETDLRLIHTHVMDPLSNCLLCHDPHGSKQPPLLLAPRKQVCSQCHELGHSK